MSTVIASIGNWLGLLDQQIRVRQPREKIESFLREGLRFSDRRYLATKSGIFPQEIALKARGILEIPDGQRGWFKAIGYAPERRRIISDGYILTGSGAASEAYFWSLWDEQLLFLANDRGDLCWLSNPKARKAADWRTWMVAKPPDKVFIDKH